MRVRSARKVNDETHRSVERDVLNEGAISRDAAVRVRDTRGKSNGDKFPRQVAAVPEAGQRERDNKRYAVHRASGGLPVRGRGQVTTVVGHCDDDDDAGRR